jgi:hypothetical protein
VPPAPDPAPSKDAEPAPPARGSADRLDVKRMIAQASTKVSVDQLVKKGTKTISLLSKDKIEAMVNQAVKNIVAKYRMLAAGLGDVKDEEVEKESQAEFNELMQQYQDAAKAKNELEQSKLDMASAMESMQKELETQKAIADGKLSEEAEKMMVVGFKDFEHELNRIAGKVYEKRKAILEGSGETPEAIAEFKQVEEKLNGIIAKLLEQQRELFFGSGGRYARDREVALLEKRMEKMYQQIAMMENALKTFSNQKLLTNVQVANMMRAVGLAPEDKNAEKKKGMLSVVLAQNLKLRKDLKDYEGKPAAPAEPAPQP